ncbi:cation transporter [Desertibaculum subflavum]|uniref:cation transporter n=1 Tax=Desertibaculum subflavum TaxID=2268458 RepID=UPI000E66A81D
MSACCDHGHDHGPPPSSDRYRLILWVALIANAAMFVVELAAGLAAGSVSLQADALDFFGDAANYAVSLAVLGMALAWRARASLVKSASMAAFGIWVLGQAAFNLATGVVPEPMTMGVVGTAALAVNIGVALLLYRYREGDSNMRSVWLCTRNDALGNIAVLAAALGVFGTGAGWPDLIVAGAMAALALTSSVQVTRHALQELRVPA